MEKRVGVSAKYIQKKCILGKIQWPKITCGAKCNGESVEVSAKYIQKKCNLGKIQWPKIRFWAKMQWRKRRGFGKTNTKKMHSGQNTMEKNCI